MQQMNVLTMMDELGVQLSTECSTRNFKISLRSLLDVAKFEWGMTKRVMP